MNDIVELNKAIKIRAAMEEYQDTVYLNMLRQINTDCESLLKEDMGGTFVKNCARDIAGEVVRNYFDTSSYYITVDQLAKRVLEFSYDNEYDPLAKNGGVGDVQKAVYNYDEISSKDLIAITEMIDNSQEQLFTTDRKKDPVTLKGQHDYREKSRDSNGVVHDDLTGVVEEKTTYIRNGKEVEKSDLQADHIQAREAATYNSRYITDEGVDRLREFWNSSDNMQMIHASANASKGDIRVCNINGEIKYINTKSSDYDPSTDITSRATPQQLAEAVCQQWENTDESREGKNSAKIEKLKEKGYLDENGKVPKSVKKRLESNIRASQNKESVVILKNTKYEKVAKDAFAITTNSLGKIIAGQIIYYAAPPIVYELRTLLKDKNLSLDNALEKFARSAERIGNYVFSKLKNIFENIAVNSLKNFIKSFMNILINTVKATVRKLLQIAKSLVLSTVDAVRIIADPNASAPEKANAVCNLYAVTITSCAVEILFEIASESLHIPKPYDDIVFGPLQILTTVICTNLTMLILKKADLFDVEFGFKMSQIRKLFSESRELYSAEYERVDSYTQTQIDNIIKLAKEQSLEIHNNLVEFDPKHDSARPELEKINKMFSMKIDFEDEWLRFIGLQA